MEFREVSQQDQAELQAYRAAFAACNESIHGGAGLAQAQSVDQWLKALALVTSKATVPTGFVQANNVAIEDGHIIGLLNLRLALNDFLRNYGGHIGYSVKPNHRKNGWGTVMLKAGLQQAQAEGLAKVLLMCDQENTASAKVIEANGGQFIDQVIDPSDGAVVYRYWIDLT